MSLGTFLDKTSGSEGRHPEFGHPFWNDWLTTRDEQTSGEGGQRANSSARAHGLNLRL
jgi:hypothetical protein